MSEPSGEALDREIGELVRTLYAAISGPAGAPRDWTTYRRLFAPGAQLTVVHAGPNGVATYERLDVESYRATRDPYFATHDVHEVEISREARVEDGLAIVLSRYASYRALDAAPFDGGVNALHLARDGAEWRIVSMAWRAGEAAAEVGRLATGEE